MRRFALGAGWILAAVLIVALFVGHHAPAPPGACSDTAVATGPAQLSDTVSMYTNVDGSIEPRIDAKASGAVCVDSAHDIHVYKEATQVTLNLTFAPSAAGATWSASPFQVSETPDGLPIKWPYSSAAPTAANGQLTVVLMREGHGKIRHYWLETTSNGVNHAADPMIRNH